MSCESYATPKYTANDWANSLDRELQQLQEPMDKLRGANVLTAKDAALDVVERIYDALLTVSSAIDALNGIDRLD